MKHLFLSALILLTCSATMAATPKTCLEQVKIAAKGLCKSNPMLGQCNIQLAEKVAGENESTSYIFDVVSNDGQITVETFPGSIDGKICYIYSAHLRMP